VDEWGNELPFYNYRLVGNTGQVFEGRTDFNGHTEPLPTGVNPLREVEFPVAKW